MGQFEKGHKPYKHKRPMHGHYIVAYSGKRKDAKRHIWGRYEEEKTARMVLIRVRNAHPKWTTHLYNSVWEVLE